MKEHSDLEEIVAKYGEYKKLNKEIEEAKELLGEKLDKEFKQMVDAELKEAERRLEEVKTELKILLLPKDPNDDKNVIVEIRGGAGGDEAALFAADLFRMYSKYAEKQRWSTEILDSNPTEIGGFKEVIFLIKGKGAYSKLKYESGVHRVQRVPTTEASGRVHTSTVTVAVLAEAEEIDVEIDPNDLRIDTFRASGAGGQHVNRTDSAIRITHIPTGMVVTCQDERSQHKNRDKAMTILRSRLYEIAQQQQEGDIAQERKSQVGTGDRSERIRTYNFPQGRITDHRIGLTLYKLENVLDGEIDEIIDALITTEQSEKLGSGEGNGEI
jgi:peptide chain release factor 1